MVARLNTVAFEGISTKDIEVQVQLSNGLPAFNIVGLPDKAVAESKERIRSALHAIGLSLPSKRITVNLSPADLHKEGSYFDLPIILGVLIVMEAFPQDAVEDYITLGELSLDGRIMPINGVLPAAIHAVASNKGLICPEKQQNEALWASNELSVLAPTHLMHLINHMKGVQLLSNPKLSIEQATDHSSNDNKDFSDVRGQESAKRGLVIAAAGEHNALLSGPPGSGTSMLASRVPTILPELSTQASLETSMIHSISKGLDNGQIVRTPPYRDPHHTASTAALIGGGQRIRPGEISLAHNGVLFLDELPEFSRQSLEALRQPLETGSVLVSRVQQQIKFPAQFQLIAAMNPCKCGYLGDASRACNKAPKCAQDYQNKISGPMLDRFDLFIDVPTIPIHHMADAPTGETSAVLKRYVIEARQRQIHRYKDYSFSTNARAEDKHLENLLRLSEEARTLLIQAAERFKLSGRGYKRLLRTSRTLADLNKKDNIDTDHIIEALAFRAMI